MRANLCEERLKPEAPGTEPFFAHAADYFGAAAWVRTYWAGSEDGRAEKVLISFNGAAGRTQCNLDVCEREEHVWRFLDGCWHCAVR